MRKASIIIHEDHLDSLVSSLHESGLMQITDIHREMPERMEELERASMHPEAGECATYELRLTRILDIFSHFSSRPGGIRALLHPEILERKEVPRSLKKIYEKASNLLKKLENEVVKSDEKIKKIDERMEEIDKEMEKVEAIVPFDLDPSWIGESEYVLIKVGMTDEIDSLKDSLKNVEVEILSREIKKRKEKFWVTVLIAHRSIDLGKGYKQFFEEMDFGELKGIPSELLNNLTKEKEELKKEKKKIMEELRKLSEDYRNDLLAIREQIHIERTRKELPTRFAKTRHAYLIEGWALEKDSSKLEEIVNEATNDHVACKFEEPESNPDGVPIHLEMPKWANSFRTFLELFSLPKYNEVNPSIFLGIFFVLFFGFMLGDAGYGFIIFIASIIGYKKFGKHSKMIKDWSFLGIWLGLVTIIIGALTNGFFGDFIPRFIYGNPDRLLYSLSIGNLHLPIDSIHQPVVILIMALLFGLVHLNVGIGLGIYQDFKRRNYPAIFKEHFPWFFLQVGGGALIGQYLLHLWELSTITLIFSFIGIGIGMSLLLINSGALGLFGITGFIGDWLSYARLLALGLATAGMALAFNIVGQIIPKIIPLGIVIAPLILVIAHLANLGIQSLGAAIHSLRLQYVEFFNRFYKGGGNKFIPFKIERKYTEE